MGDKCERDFQIEDVVSLADKTTKLDPTLANRLAQQQGKCEAGIAIEDVGSLADKKTNKLDPALAKRFAEQQSKCETFIAIKDVGSFITDRLPRLFSGQLSEHTREGEKPEASVVTTSTVDTFRESDTVLRPQVGGELRWMWADAGVSPGLSRRLAKRNPLRWSKAQNVHETIATLKSYCTGDGQRRGLQCAAGSGENCGRPIRMEIRRQAQSEVLMFANIEAVISHLSGSE